MKALLTATAAVLAAATWAWPADAPTPAAADDFQDFVYFAPGRPLLVRAHVRIEGKPLKAAWEEFINKVFDTLDTDKDGVLSAKEAERIPPAQLLLGGGTEVFAVGKALSALTPRASAEQGGKITRAALAARYRTSGAAPFQVQVGGGSPADRQVIYLGQPAAPPPAEALNDALFALLDTDKDGKLSREELAAAPAVLSALDANDDEMITPTEIVPNAAPASGQSLAAGKVVRMSGQPAAADGPILLLSPGDKGAALARELLTRYAPKSGERAGARKLAPADLGLDRETFAALDADGDGELDAEELAHFGERAPDLELTVRLGRAPGQDAVDLTGPAGSLAGQVKKSGKAIGLDLGVTRIDLKAARETGMTFAGLRRRDRYIAQFKAADRDGNGYLDETEARQSPIFRDIFKFLDADGDGKLFEKEMIAALDKLQELQDAAQECCATVAITDRGSGLFEQLDRNRDGRLSVRELREAPRLLEKLDRDGDGRLARNEIPRNVELNFRPGPAAGRSLGDGVVVVAKAFGRSGGPQTPAPTAGPLWFRKMDRNRDGDVSRREFVGTDEQFRAIDTDHDGLISVEEAERHDKRLRAAAGDK